MWDRYSKEDIKGMTETEVDRVIFSYNLNKPWVPVGMPEYVAQAVLECEHFSWSMRKWAHETLCAEDESTA